MGYSAEKKERALGVHLNLKAFRCQSPKCAAVRRPTRPGTQGKSRRRALSDFGRQLQEKQKFKVTYGLDDRNLKEIFKKASKYRGSVSEKLVELLERRLDNAIFRLGIAPSRTMGRNFVRQGHITVNGKKVVSPGFQVRTGDVISVSEKSAGRAIFKDLAANLKKYDAPEWLELDAENKKGKVKMLPQHVEIPFEANLLVESFSK